MSLDRRAKLLFRFGSVPSIPVRPRDTAAMTVAVRILQARCRQRAGAPAFRALQSCVASVDPQRGPLPRVAAPRWCELGWHRVLLCRARHGGAVCISRLDEPRALHTAVAWRDWPATHAIRCGLSLELPLSSELVFFQQLASTGRPSN